MVGLEDLYAIATSLDREMLAMNVRQKTDYRDDILVTLKIPQLDLQVIEEQLYEREHNTLVGYDKGDEIDVNVIGINFKLVKKETE